MGPTERLTIRQAGSFRPGDSTYTSGRLGINTFNGTGEFQDVNVFIE
ncbi:hypothetical protein ACWD0A_11325 [Streptomyces sp. NPDC002867]